MGGDYAKKWPKIHVIQNRNWYSPESDQWFLFLILIARRPYRTRCPECSVKKTTSASLLKKGSGTGIVFLCILQNFKDTFFTEHLQGTVSGRWDKWDSSNNFHVYLAYLANWAVFIFLFSILYQLSRLPHVFLDQNVLIVSLMR